MAVLAPVLLILAAMFCGPVRGRRTPIVAAVGALALAGVTAPTHDLPRVLTAAQVVTLSLVVVVTAFSRRHLDGDPRHVRYDRWLLLTAGTAVLALSTGDLLVFAAAWVVTGVGITALVGHHQGLPATDRAVGAMRRARLVGDAALLLAVAALAAAAGGSSIDRVATWAAGHPSSPVLPAAALALFVATAARCGLLPFSRWVPLSVVAPAPVSALLHAGIVNAPVLLLLQLRPVWAHDVVLAAVLCAMGLLTAVATFPRLLVRADVKTRLAWSTTAQMGFVVTLVAVGAYAAAVLHMTLHGIYKAAAFLGAGDQLSRARRDSVASGSRGGRAVGAVAGLLAGAVLVTLDAGWEHPLTATAVVVAMVAAGIGLMSVRASAGPRLVAGATIVAVAGAVLAAAHGTADLLDLPLRADGALAWIAAAVVATLAVVSAYVRARAPMTGWAVLNRLADPVVPVGTGLRLRRAARGGQWRPLPTRPFLHEPLEGDIAFAAEAVPPAWGWQSFIATNPLLGEQYLPFGAAVEVARSRGWSALPGLRAEAPVPAPLPADDLVAGWLAAWTCLGDVPWAAPDRDRGLWEWFRAVAVHDPVLPPQARAWLRELPGEPLDVIAGLMPLTGRPVDTARAQLLRLPGWAGYLGRAATSGAALDVRAMTELLAVQLATAHAVGGGVRTAVDRPSAEATAGDRVEAAAGGGPCATVAAGGAAGGPPVPDVEAGLVALAAREDVLRATLLDRLPATLPDQPAGRRQADLVFCIDVRSEPLRRHLEARADVRTVGFAGFFGLSVRRAAPDGRTSDRCPAPLGPIATVAEAAAGRPGASVLLAAALRSALDAPGGGFAAVDAASLKGLSGFLRIVLPGARRVPRPAVGPLGAGVDAPELVAAAVSAVRATGLHGPATAPVVVLVGHGSTSTNNPAESAFDCGACGGQRGAFNARLAARVLNSPAGRAALVDQGLALPEDTVVVAAEHDTSLDRVILLEPEAVPPGHAAALASLAAALDAATAATADERCRALPGGAAVPARPGGGTRFVRRRALDPAEVRHEWGLLGNAFFVAAPRDLTAGLDLGGRAFLHDYDPERDADGAMLETILTAPLVVAHWINAQYFFSTADPERLGAGSKTAHNPVGAVGVLAGPGGDLRTGLAEQSVRHHGRPVREPVRLLAVVAATPDAVDAVLANHPSLSELVTGGWLTLCVVDLRGGAQRMRSAGGWVERAGTGRPAVGRRCADDLPV